jgi:hypothetical protein
VSISRYVPSTILFLRQWITVGKSVLLDSRQASFQVFDTIRADSFIQGV